MKQRQESDKKQPGGKGGIAKIQQRLARAEVSRQKVERKVGKLRARLENAESKLAKRVARITALRSRTTTDAQGDTEAAVVADEIRLESLKADEGGAQNGDRKSPQHRHGHGSKKS